jgi:hypothetical protein
MVLRVRTTDGVDVALGVPRDQLMQLIDHCALSDRQCERILCSGVESRVAVSWWNSALDRESKEFVLTVTFGKGGSLSIALTEHMAKALLATLRTHFEAGALGAVPERAAKTRSWPEQSLERTFELP